MGKCISPVLCEQIVNIAKNYGNKILFALGKVDEVDEPTTDGYYLTGLLCEIFLQTTPKEGLLRVKYRVLYPVEFLEFESLPNCTMAKAVRKVQEVGDTRQSSLYIEKI